MTARGIYEVFLNGTRVGDDYYNPGLSQYNITHFYQTYDVTSLVRAGGNAIGAVLSEGWWSGLLSFGAIWNHFGDRQSLLAKLVITYADGTSDTVTTNDRTWKYFANGPVVYGSLDFGEVYDSAREHAVEGWATAAYDDRAWKPAVEVPTAGTTFASEDVPFGGGPKTRIAFDRLSLTGQIGDTARVFRTLPAKRVKEVRPGVFVYDLGQNIVGVPRITIAERARGDEDDAAVCRDALSGPPGVGQERRHDHDRELPRGAEPGRLHHEGRAAGVSSRGSPRMDSSTSRSPGSSRRCRWRPSRASPSAPCTR